MKIATLLCGLCLLVSQVQAAADASLTCKDDGKIRYRKFGKMVEEKTSYCYDKDRLLSAACSRKASCDALTAIAKKDDAAIAKSANNAFGTPSFHACRMLGGEPQLMEYFDGANWVPTDRCVFKSDGSYVNAARLLLKP